MKSRQSGAVLFILLLLILVGAGTIFVSRLKSAQVDLEAQGKTAAALAEAKAALIGYAASDANKPGSLPCPDANNDGQSGLADYSGANCVAPVGRLPWKTLGLPDLRDGAGERLWYAVSPNFAANASTALNASVNGQITVRTANGTIVYDGTGPSAAVAVIIAPGAPLARQGQALPQNRSCTAGVDCDSSDVCITPSPFTATPKCDPRNYLDVVVSLEDNADFQASATNGFIMGPVRAVANPNQAIVNDMFAVISPGDLFSVVKKRVFSEMKGTLLPQAGGCSSPPTTGLVGFAAANSYFPWAATTEGGASVANTNTGFLPSHDLSFASRMGGSGCYDQGAVLSSQGWYSAAVTTYTVSPAFSPNGSGNCMMPMGGCLTVNGVANAKAKLTIGGTDFGIW
jgi:hypothetical protein